MVGGSSHFHSLSGLFVIPRNKAVPAGLRVGQAVFPGLTAFTLSLASLSFTLAVQGGDGLYAQAPHLAIWSSQSPRLRLGFSPSFLRPRSNWPHRIF